MTSSSNRLASETSSYLRSAAHQPVDWMPWGQEAFETARRLDKPILLDIGAVWCHWCHVMDHESYEDPAVAELINRLYVAVKVDRDERPDVDSRYQRAIQAMTGQGGWPLTAFLLPDGRVFYGGTYFPPREAHGRPSFRRVLEAVAQAYADRREEVLQSAAHLAEHLGRGLGGAQRPAGQGEWAEVLDAAVAGAREEYDATHGGFGRAPKFPHPAAVDFLIERAMRGDAASAQMAVGTLDAMRDGGIHDHVVGGFHRYSVDAKWIVPHFEKMLYDNAGLLRNYVRGAIAFGREDYHAVAAGVVEFMRDVLRQPEGGFGGSQDADVGPDDDGDHFTWALDELHAAIPDEDLARLMALHYDVEETGDMHHDPSRNVLHVVADAAAVAAATGRELHDVQADLARGRGLMREARAKRPRPFVDPIRYTAWNAMAIQALLEYGGAFAAKEVDALALEALDAMIAGAYDPARGFSRAPGSRTFGLLDDNAQMLDALLEAHHATGDARYLDLAKSTGELLLSHFRHPDGGFADRADALAPPAESAALATPERPVQDAPTASPNGVALRALLRLTDATGDERYGAFAREALASMAPLAARLSVFGGALLLALDHATHPPPRIVVARGDPAPWRALARRRAKPGATFAAPGDAGLPPEAAAFQGEGALVCLGTRCLAPARTLEDFQERLAEARRGAA